ncbi:MAG: hypothetical protein KJ944_10530 [Alphaproteobacteria bacterium]|nr:hypothetical protein [Alphaproteobacteria bacterium]MBU1561703.1 hypothetical protein [Alphaproteobacteria bacterium]MBU2303023.1 hypothetical protein [Alphaproteobacteria bacterium]MBU2368809.1 hypothetical protein [Alphaproteobacteria bacterium]
MKQTLNLTARESGLAKRLIERGYTLPGLVKSGQMTKVRELARAFDDEGGSLRLTNDEAEAFASLMAASMEKFPRDFSPAEVDAVEQLFVRVEIAFKVKLRA